MKIAVIGSREGFTEEQVEKEMQKRFDFLDTTDILITGGAKGVDTFAADIMKRKTPYPLIPRIEIIRPIDPSNKLHYLFRNIEIICKCDYILAFWNGTSKGTKFVIDYAKARNKNIEVIRNDDGS